MSQLYKHLSFSCSENVTNAYSTSFSLAVKMLSTEIQPAIHSIYGFVRLADEIVDTFHDQPQETLLNEFESDLNQALSRQFSLNPILHSFQDTVHTYDISRAQIDAFLKSMRADLYQYDYENVADYEEYIYGSADVVGLMCLKVFVNGDQARYDELKYAATKLGSAFQKVNFLRDLKDDTEILNRNYFPHLYGKRMDNALKQQIIEEIELDFAEAYVGVQSLPMRARFGVYTAYVYYKKLLTKIKRLNAEAIHENRIRISNPAKFGLLLTSFVNHKLNLL